MGWPDGGRQEPHPMREHRVLPVQLKAVPDVAELLPGPGALRPRMRRSALDGRVDLVEQRGAIRQLEVVAQVAVGLVARLAVEGHVERDEAGPLDVAALGAAPAPSSASGASNGSASGASGAPSTPAAAAASAAGSSAARGGLSRAARRAGSSATGSGSGSAIAAGSPARAPGSPGPARPRRSRRRARRPRRRAAGAPRPRRPPWPGGRGVRGLRLAPRRVVQVAHVALEQRQVGGQAVRARAQALHERAELGLHRVDALEHRRGGPAAPGRRAPRCGRRPRRACCAASDSRVGPDARRVLLGAALDVGGAASRRPRRSRGPARRPRGERGGPTARAPTEPPRLARGGGQLALQALDLLGQRREVRVDGVGLVAAAAMGKSSSRWSGGRGPLGLLPEGWGDGPEERA